MLFRSSPSSGAINSDSSAPCSAPFAKSSAYRLARAYLRLPESRGSAARILFTRGGSDRGGGFGNTNVLRFHPVYATRRPCQGRPSSVANGAGLRRTPRAATRAIGVRRLEGGPRGPRPLCRGAGASARVRPPGRTPDHGWIAAAPTPPARLSQNRRESIILEVVSLHPSYHQEKESSP